MYTSTDRVVAYLQKETGTGEALDGARILIWPNPADGRFTISSSNTSIEFVRIMNFAGKVIMHRYWEGNTEQLFDLGREPAGIYIIQVKTTEKVFMEKIIIL
jgi:hypothetical protein